MSEKRKLPQSVEEIAEESKPTTSSSNVVAPPSGPTRRAVLRSAALAATGGALLGAAGTARGRRISGGPGLDDVYARAQHDRCAYQSAGRARRP